MKTNLPYYPFYIILILVVAKIHAQEWQSEIDTPDNRSVTVIGGSELAIWNSQVVNSNSFITSDDGDFEYFLIKLKIIALQ